MTHRHPDPVLSAGVAVEPAGRSRPLPWHALLLASVAWFVLWYLTPGLLSNGVGHLFTDDLATSVAIETAIAVVFAVMLVLTHRRYNV